MYKLLLLLLLCVCILFVVLLATDKSTHLNNKCILFVALLATDKSTHLNNKVGTAHNYVDVFFVFVAELYSSLNGMLIVPSTFLSSQFQ